MVTFQLQVTTFQFCNDGGNGVGIGKKISISSIGGPDVGAHDPFSTCSIHSRTLKPVTAKQKLIWRYALRIIKIVLETFKDILII